MQDESRADTPAGIGYFQCVREAPPKECELIRVLPKTYLAGEAREFLNEIVAGREAFFVKFPLRGAVHRGCVRFVDRFPVPEDVRLPRYYRSKHVFEPVRFK